METEIIKWGGWIVGIVVSSLLYFFPARRKELDEATSKLIVTLQGTVKALEDDLNIYKSKTLDLEKNQKENIAKLNAIEGEKALLKEFIAGRDKATTAFQEEAMKLHSQNSEKLTQLVDLLSKHFLTMEQAAMLGKTK